MMFDLIRRRRLMHTRRVTCEAYVREDGLYEIESILIDNKHHAVQVGNRGAIATGEPFREMRVLLLIDVQLNVHDIEAQTMHAPYAQCSEISSACRALKGLNLGHGFMKQARQLLGGVAGCTHMN